MNFSSERRVHPRCSSLLRNASYPTTTSTSYASVDSLFSVSSLISVPSNTTLSQDSDDSRSSASDTEQSYRTFSFPTQFSNLSQTSISSVESLCEPSVKHVSHWQKSCAEQAKGNRLLRQNPRRTNRSATSRTGHPPSLVRQDDRKVNFVDTVVDAATLTVEAIWPLSSACPRNGNGANPGLSLRQFIQETLKRSRSSYSTLTVALYYLILIKPRIPACDFTMEQPRDCLENPGLQCGRRMFLAALILASKYLQDRNYSAKAWSKISGLNVKEINQNEMAFLLAVNWKLHIPDHLYERWTECMAKLNLSLPPCSGSAAQQIYQQQCANYKTAVRKLTPELDNIEEVASWFQQRSPVVVPTVARSLYTPPFERSSPFESKAECRARVPAPMATPAVMEPSPFAVQAECRMAPALGLLPSPRPTPQLRAMTSTPAVSAVSCLLAKGSSMGYAMHQASHATAAQVSDRWPSASSPPYLTRRSSLANSVSTASSPESMISDSSQLSRSSSFSATSVESAPSSDTDAQARYQYGKQDGEKYGLQPVIVSAHETYGVNTLTLSPESCYMDPAGQNLNDYKVAALALQDLRRQGDDLPARAGMKRARAPSTDKPLQDNVRDLLSGMDSVRPSRQMPVRSFSEESYKRLCFSVEDARPAISSLHPAMGGIGGPGMWDGILC
ncbi:cyclin-domain-containing protein [Neurospora crassa]|nr:cyclin-domain-containing protein [Neurospora crassa]